MIKPHETIGAASAPIDADVKAMVFAVFYEFYCYKHLDDLAVMASPHAIPDANGLAPVWQACKNSLAQTSRIDHDEYFASRQGRVRCTHSRT